MEIATVSLVSKDESLTKSVAEVIGSFTNLRLEIHKELDELDQLEDKQLALLLIHSRDCSPAAIHAMVESARGGRLPVATLILSDEMDPAQALALFRLGVVDYLVRPLDAGRLTYLVDVLTVRARHAQVNGPVGEKAVAFEQKPRAGGSFCAVSPLMEQLMSQVQRIAPQDTTILLTGETGTGKTCLARVVHELSNRSQEPFQVIDCGALSGNLIESEMFGHVRGAFTGANRDYSGKFAAVGRGTLLLDEVDALPFALQTKLLRAVDERVFEAVGSTKSQKLQARLIVATNRSLEQEVAAGRFRADLYYRLNVIGFYLPPLRERTTAVAPLARGFLSEFVGRRPDSVKGISLEAMRLLEQYSWPGNVRELRNCVERAVALSNGPEIQPIDLPDAIRRALPPVLGPAASAGVPVSTRAATLNLAEIKEEAELARLIHALQKHGRSRKQVAQELGISRTALYNKLNKYGLVRVTKDGTEEDGMPPMRSAHPAGALSAAH